MRITKDWLGSERIHCNQCKGAIYIDSDLLTPITFLFGSPFIKCNKCGFINKTYFKPYSKISTFSKIQYWFKVIPFPLIINFIAAPLFIFGFGSKLLLGKVLEYQYLFILLSVTFIFGIGYIIFKHKIIISKIESEHKEVGEKYWEY